MSSQEAISHPIPEVYLSETEPSDASIQVFTNHRLNQLKSLLNPHIDAPGTWQEEVATRIHFRGGYSYKIRKETRTFTPEEAQKLRSFAAFALLNELDSLGCRNEALIIINASKPKCIT